MCRRCTAQNLLAVEVLLEVGPARAVREDTDAIARSWADRPVESMQMEVTAPEKPRSRSRFRPVRPPVLSSRGIESSLPGTV